VSDLTKARAIAAAATPGGVCAGPAPPQTTHRDTPQLSCPECGPDLDVFYMTYDPPTVAAMLYTLEAVHEYLDAPRRSPNGSGLGRAKMRVRLDRARDLIGDDRE